MATTVTTGGVSTQGNRTYLFGTSSGINTSALVEAAYNQRISEADKIDVKVSTNTAKREAYAKLQTLANAVKTSLSSLRKSYGFSSTAVSAFDKRTGTLATNNTTDPSKLLGVAIDNGTNLNAYNIEVIQKAAANRIGSNTSTDPTVALGYTGKFNIGLAGGASSVIDVTSTMTMNDLATAINASTTTSGVTASVIKVSSTAYQLVLSANTTAKDITTSVVSGTNVMNSIGVTSGGTPANVLQASAQAILKLDDVQITRDTNQIDDLIKGVHLTIKNAEPGTTISMDIANDNSSIKDAVLSFTDSYNALREYIITNQTVAEGGDVADDAILFGDNLLRSFGSSLQGIISGNYGSGGTALSSLRELGITLTPTNTFEVDETKLDDAILNKFNEVKAMFTTSITSDSSSNFSILGNTSTLKTLNAPLFITADSSGVLGVSVNGVPNLFDVSGTNITGKAGTIYEGLSFAYLGTVNKIVTVTMNQGLGDLMDNTIRNYSDSVTGSWERERQRLNDLNNDMSGRGIRIRERADEYREKLIDKYAGYEAQIARSKSIISQLKAILGLKDD